MKYIQLPGLQNFKRLNHRIAVGNSPFYFIDRLQEWKPLKDENNQACVSDTQNQFVLHPSLMDAALKATTGLLMLEPSWKEQAAIAETITS